MKKHLLFLMSCVLVMGAGNMYGMGEDKTKTKPTTSTAKKNIPVYKKSWKHYLPTVAELTGAGMIASSVYMKLKNKDGFFDDYVGFAGFTLIICGMLYKASASTYYKCLFTNAAGKTLKFYSPKPWNSDELSKLHALANTGTASEDEDEEN